MEKHERTSTVFAIVASLLSLSAYIAYSWKTLVGDTHPNISSWTVWGFLTILNFTSYKKVTGDWVKSILPTVNSIMAIVTLLCALRTGSFKALGVIDMICLSIGFIAGLFWWVRKSASFAQVLLQVSILVGFIPTFVGAYQSPGTELWLAWLVWTVSFICQFLTVRFTWKGRYIEFLYPVNMILCHAAVFLLVIR